MSLFKTAVNGVAWTTISTIVRSVVSLLQVAILTRFLEKADFGLIAIATFFIGISQIFQDLGLSAGILHKQDITSKEYSSLFWLNVIIGFSLSALLCAISPIVAQWYKESELVPITCLLSTTIFLSSLGSQHRIVQQKKLRFRYISIVEISSSILMLIVAVLLAYKGFGVYSLVYSTIVGTACAGLLFLGIGLLKDRNVTFHFRLNETRKFLKIGVFSMGSQILDYFSRELDILIIGSTVGKDAVGVYSLCKKIVLAVFSAINPTILKVLTPILSLLQKDKGTIRKMYMDVVQTISIVNIPLYYLIGIFSFGILSYLYGPVYAEGEYVLLFMALSYGIVSSNTAVGSLQIAMGRTDVGLYWTILRIILTVITIYFSSSFGITGIALGMLVLNIASHPILWLITVFPLIKGRYVDFFKVSLLLFFAIGLFSLPFYYMFHSMSSVLICLSIGMIYVVVLYFLMRKLYNNAYLWDILDNRFIPQLKKRLNRNK